MDCTLRITTFTDPNCPWAFSAEQFRLALQWAYGEQLSWRRAYVVIAERAGQSEAAGFTPEVEAEEDAAIAVAWGMPLWTRPRPRITTSLRPVRHLVAARRLGAGAEERLLRQLFLSSRGAGRPIDETGELDAAAAAAGLDAERVRAMAETPAVDAELAAEMGVARRPSPAALQLSHKLGGPAQARRYSSPTWVFESGTAQMVAPGFQPPETYDTLIANLAPAVRRAAPATSAAEVLAWAGRPLATAEVARVRGLRVEEARQELPRVADLSPLGADGLWSLRVPGSAPGRVGEKRRRKIFSVIPRSLGSPTMLQCEAHRDRMFCVRSPAVLTIAQRCSRRAICEPAAPRARCCSACCSSAIPPPGRGCCPSR